MFRVSPFPVNNLDLRVSADIDEIRRRGMTGTITASVALQVKI